MKLLYLSEENMIKAGVKDMIRCIDIMEDTFRLLHINDYRLGGINNSEHGLRTKFPKESNVEGMPLDAPGRWFTVMPAYLGGKYHVFGIKSYGANQKNPENGMPRSVLMMQLLDVENGMPLAYMSANILSAMRTGAVSGLFAKYFANRHAKKVAIIGPGVMGRYSLDAIMVVCSEIEEISVYGRGINNRQIFKEHCIKNNYIRKQYNDCDSIAEACKDADIIVTANSQTSKFGDYPLIKREFLKEGACVIVTSALRIDRSYLKESNNDAIFVADDKRMYMEHRGIDAKPETESEKQTVTVKGALTELIENGKEILNFPEIIDNSDFTKDEKATYFCASGGLPIEDVAWAYECFIRAKKEGIGTELQLWNESEL